MVTFALLIIIIGVALLLFSLKATFAMITIAILVVGIGIVLLLYSLYATVIKNKNAVLEALSGIDVQLRKRYDLIPNLLTIAKKFMEHENELFGKITELRSKAINSKIGTREKFKAEAELDAQLKALMVNVENYPALKSDATMMQAMQTYNEVRVIYGIDQKGISLNGELRVYGNNEILPPVDVIVVTAVFDFDVIKKQLSSKASCPIVSLWDVVYSLDV